MKKKIIPKPFVIGILLFLNTSIGLSQYKLQNGDVYHWFDSQVGQQNTQLYNGIEVPFGEAVDTEKHPYFGKSDFVELSMVYNDQLFNKVYGKYDVFQDELILHLKALDGVKQIRAVKNKVSSFDMGRHRFIHMDLPSNLGIPGGFFELIFRDEKVMLLKKHTKKVTKRIQGGQVLEEYVFRNPKYVLKTEGTFYSIKKAGDLKKIFPEKRKMMNTGKTFKPSNLDETLIYLLQTIAK